MLKIIKQLQWCFHILLLICFLYVEIYEKNARIAFDFQLLLSIRHKTEMAQGLISGSRKQVM